MIWSIDGLQWDLGCTVTRTSEMTSSEISGMLLDKTYFNDVIGTYLRYDIRIEVPIGKEQEYASLYETITNPVSAHEFVLPYGTGTREVVGRIANIKDVYVRMPRGGVHWKGIQFSIISNHPIKTISLDDAISSWGVPALPTQSDVDIGAVYIYDTGGWTEVSDADNNYY